MLILSRKAGEQIVIGEGIVLIVKRISGKRVTVGIQAPPGVHIRRGELELMVGDEEPAAVLSPTAAITMDPVHAWGAGATMAHKPR